MNALSWRMSVSITDGASVFHAEQRTPRTPRTPRIPPKMAGDNTTPNRRARGRCNRQPCSAGDKAFPERNRCLGTAPTDTGRRLVTRCKSDGLKPRDLCIVGEVYHVPPPPPPCEHSTPPPRQTRVRADDSLGRGTGFRDQPRAPVR